jgi:hypothetical protein
MRLTDLNRLERLKALLEEATKPLIKCAATRQKRSTE